MSAVYLARSGASPPLSIYKGNLNKNVNEIE
jgi:hypothetical protein